MDGARRTLYANIIVDISHESVDRTFQYIVPPELTARVRVGSAVLVPFGKGNREHKGYVLKLTDIPEWAPEKMKPLTSVIENETGAEADAIRLAAWMRERYGSTMITALKTVLPVKRKVADKLKRTVVRVGSAKEAEQAAARYEGKHQCAKARLLKQLVQHESLPYELVTAKLHIGLPTIRALEKTDDIRLLTEREYRSGAPRAEHKERAYPLSGEQQEAAERVVRAVRAGSGEHFLLYGITGSGKTEVYLEIAKRVVESGKQAIILIPEIALTYQTVMRFYERFGERVAVVHSRLSQGERYDACERAKKGLADVVIGPRSALFTPFERIGVIIIDEEHEPSYKSENMPRYHAREAAFELASYHRASVVLGSATPSLEAYRMAQERRITLLKLTKRLTGGTLPNVSVTDMREELKQGNRSMFSDRLARLLADRMEKGEQSMLFLNRRGVAGFVSCRACGHVMRCPHCDVSLTQHRGGRLICHYCGYEQAQPAGCPQCGSKYILGFKAGTQQVEDAVKRLFPQARVLRMDADTTRGKESYDEILSSFLNEEADVLVGTQMIVKGHDFPNVTLVGILAADLSLNANDYRAGERTFDLLTQAAGRAGRGRSAGEVVIQTYQPEHYSIRYAAAQDYEGFYREELAYREFLRYPPMGHLLAVQVYAADEEAAERLAQEIKRRTQASAKERGVLIMGPAPAALRKVKDIFREVLYYKHREYEPLLFLREEAERYLEEKNDREETVLFDMDPMNLI
ncbi:MAG: primosomal protein N' [Clostridium sp.]|nr:primosomal protein N' [Clostridium sp.]